MRRSTVETRQWCDRSVPARPGRPRAEQPDHGLGVADVDGDEHGSALPLSGGRGAGTGRDWRRFGPRHGRPRHRQRLGGGRDGGIRRHGRQVVDQADRAEAGRDQQAEAHRPAGRAWRRCGVHRARRSPRAKSRLAVEDCGHDPSTAAGSVTPSSSMARFAASRRPYSAGAATARSCAAQAGVAAGQGQSVGVADRRAAHDHRRQRQVGDQPPDHGQLLEVLLAEVGPARAGQGQELGHDGAPPRRSGRAARLPFEPVAERRRRTPWWPPGSGPQVGTVGAKTSVGPGLDRAAPVPVEVAGVGGQVVARRELQRVDVDGDRHDVALGGGPADQRQVPGVQRPHGGHQTDRPAGAPGPSEASPPLVAGRTVDPARRVTLVPWRTCRSSSFHVPAPGRVPFVRLRGYRRGAPLRASPGVEPGPAPPGRGPGRPGGPARNPAPTCAGGARPGPARRRSRRRPQDVDVEGPRAPTARPGPGRRRLSAAWASPSSWRAVRSVSSSHHAVEERPLARRAADRIGLVHRRTATTSGSGAAAWRRAARRVPRLDPRAKKARRRAISPVGRRRWSPRAGGRVMVTATRSSWRVPADAACAR